jgi:hypothetical protein
MTSAARPHRRRMVPVRRYRAELQPVAERILKRGFHELAHEVHLDHGGTDAEMCLVVAAYEFLCARFKVER